MIGSGDPGSLLDPTQVHSICAAGLESWAVDGGRVLVLIPDGTRSCPLGSLFREVYAALAPRVASLDFMIALGTHAALTTAEIHARLEIDAESQRRDFPQARFFNHAWDEPGALREIGRWSCDQVEQLTAGRLSVEVPIELNAKLTEYDHLLIVGPVFPHEVAGFSGGNKYLFPGVAGPAVIHFFHWLGALITNRDTIGRKQTAVRAIIDAAAARLDLDRRALCMVVGRDGGLHGLYWGSPEAAWSRAADLSAQVHVVYHDRSYRTVLACAPAMYPDLWTGGKAVYKLEPVVADGGRLIVYAPHIREVSRVHGAVLTQVGYHVRDYFVAQWPRFRDLPWGVLAHSTHVKGAGEYRDGTEYPRISVELATGISEAECRALALGHADPNSIDPQTFGGDDPGLLRVAQAGEVLHLCR